MALRLQAGIPVSITSPIARRAAQGKISTPKKIADPASVEPVIGSYCGVFLIAPVSYLPIVPT